MPPRIAPGRGSGPSRGGGPTRGGGAGRGGVPVAIAAHVQTVGVRRPGYGTGGKVVNTIVNAFPVTIPDGIKYHYDDIVPDKLPARLNMVLFDRLQNVVATQVFSAPAIYDGRKNAFTTYRLPLGPDSAQFDVTLERDGPSDRPPKIYKIKLTKVAEINMEVLHRFIAGQQTQDNPVLTGITLLNIVIRMEPNLKHPFNVRSFFTERGKRAIGGGLELWRGYFQSIRPSQNFMYINLDISTGVMYKAGPLLSLCLDYLNQKNPNALSPRTRPPLPDRERLRLQRFISGMRVTTKYTGRTKTLVIKRLTSESASSIMFSMRQGGPSISVADYFKKHLNMPLKFPDVICIEVGSAGAMIPLELCEVPPGQIMRKQIPADKTNDMVEFSKLRPSERLASIRAGLEVLQYGQSPYIREFGMDITQTPISVKSRVLPTPALRYGQGSRESTIKPANGQWNMRDKMFYRPSMLKTWAIVIYESQGRFNQAAAQEMATSFCAGARSVGMPVEDQRPLIFWENGSGNIGEHLKKAGKACVDAGKGPPNLIVVVLPEGGNQIYTAVKQCAMGVATQCLKSMKCRGAKMQYWANVMLKVNVKLGGINAILDNSPLNDPNNPTIVMGADVIHPAPGAEGRPSFTSLVSSVDINTAKYVSTSCVQTGRQEIISDLETMCKSALTKYNGYGNAFEKGRRTLSRLIFYRDGVSEGQFAHVLEKEACQDMKVNPKITLIIVGKRHHIRMFPQNERDGDKSGNCQAGTTIDEGLGHPTEFDYYQLTHGGLLGTSRPAHYSVADAMQNLSFALCHVYARATRSVSIPAPVYYADIVCSRAKNHYAPGSDLDLSETATQTSSHAESQLQAFKQGYKPLNPKMENLMYFMVHKFTSTSVSWILSTVIHSERHGPISTSNCGAVVRLPETLLFLSFSLQIVHMLSPFSPYARNAVAVPYG
ncbi:argonaute-like protein [Flammula alnicola]|nr:argonaute-like protein [Flammula alnicola]